MSRQLISVLLPRTRCVSNWNTRFSWLPLGNWWGRGQSPLGTSQARFAGLLRFASASGDTPQPPWLTAGGGSKTASSLYHELT